MSKYILYWELDDSRLPQETESRAAIVSSLLDRVKADQAEGKVKEWGTFLGGGQGFALVEGEDIDVAVLMHQYRPYVRFESQPYLAMDRLEEMFKALSQVKK